MSILLGRRKSGARYRASRSKYSSTLRTLPTTSSTLMPPTARVTDLLARATKLRWICATCAGLGGAWFYDALVKSDVIVTNMRGSYNEHLAGHAVAFLLAFARRFDHYFRQKRWQRGPEMIDLPQKTVLIVGVGGAGGEASKLCAALGMRVLGIDPRITGRPAGTASGRPAGLGQYLAEIQDDDRRK
jgi:phosphoglycerate dehydrogenase-like enzyme